MKQIEVKALAKINLGLDVLGKREDGYHEVRMVMQTLYLCDYIKIELKKAPGIELKTNLYYLPADAGNLAYRAAALLAEEFRVREGIRITLKKRIPVAAGLAGGSSDAAAVLFGLNRLLELHLPQEQLKDLGVRLGADVPYCLMRGTVLAEGIGERLTRLAPMPECCVLLAKPPVSVSTRVVYEALDSQEVAAHPDMELLLAGIKKGKLPQIAAAMGNILEEVTIPMCPVIQEIKEVMKAAGALNAMMSGSGPTVFGLFQDKRRAEEALQVIWKKGLAKQVYLTGIHNNIEKNKKQNRTADVFFQK